MCWCRGDGAGVERHDTPARLRFRLAPPDFVVRAHERSAHREPAGDLLALRAGRDEHRRRGRPLDQRGEHVDLRRHEVARGVLGLGDVDLLRAVEPGLGLGLDRVVDPVVALVLRRRVDHPGDVTARAEDELDVVREHLRARVRRLPRHDVVFLRRVDERRQVDAAEVDLLAELGRAARLDRPLARLPREADVLDHHRRPSGRPVQQQETAIHVRQRAEAGTLDGDLHALYRPQGRAVRDRSSDTARLLRGEDPVRALHAARARAGPPPQKITFAAE